MAVIVIGAGPAGSSAALAALQEGSEVSLYDKSRFPRHKVCGEFLSPEAAELLERLAVWDTCGQMEPSVLRRVFLQIGERTKSWKLAEPARGFSRYSMDQILLQAAVSRGAVFQQETARDGQFAVIAHGRNSRASTVPRLFGFKAHFTGPTDDVMSLYFFRGAYVGVNAIEGGRTNVCGLAPEPLLSSYRFDIDEMIRHSRAVSERLRPLTRSMKWLYTGPLVFGPAQSRERSYAAGDALAFIDPFTGSGMLGAISTGMLAGRAAAHGRDPAEYKSQATELLRHQQNMARWIRAAVRNGWAERVLPFVPGKVLFHTTRPTRVLA